MGKPYSYLFFFPGRFLYIGPALDTHTHAHHALQLLLSLDVPFQLRTDEQPFQDHMNVLIDSDTAHECRGNGSTIAFLQLDPGTRLARHLKQAYLTSAPIQPLPQDLLEPVLDQLRALINPSPSGDGITDWLQVLTHTLAGRPASNPFDERVVAAQAMLRNSLHQPPTLAQLADAVCLSQGRLTHLFKEQVGIAIRHYILWERLLMGIRYLSAEATLTEMAHEAGFSDQAHFSRTFTRMFGLSPSLLTRWGSGVKVYVCDD